MTLGEVLDRLELIEGVDDPLRISGQGFEDQHVPDPRKRNQLSDEVLRELREEGQVADRLSVILESDAATG